MRLVSEALPTADFTTDRHVDVYTHEYLCRLVSCIKQQLCNACGFVATVSRHLKCWNRKVWNQYSIGSRLSSRTESTLQIQEWIVRNYRSDNGLPILAKSRKFYTPAGAKVDPSVFSTAIRSHSPGLSAKGVLHQSIWFMLKNHLVLTGEYDDWIFECRGFVAKLLLTTLLPNVSNNANALLTRTFICERIERLANWF